jgi:hypothetical protein
MNLLHIASLFIIAQLPARDTLPVVTISPPHLGVSISYGGYFVKLRNESGSISLPWPAPGLLPTGLPWFVDIQNLGPGAVTIEEGRDISIHLLPKQSVRIVSNKQRYTVNR